MGVGARLDIDTATERLTGQASLGEDEPRESELGLIGGIPRTKCSACPQYFTYSDFELLIDEVGDVVDGRAIGLSKAGVLADLCYDPLFERKFGLLYSQCRDIDSGMDLINYRDAAAFAFLGNETLLDLVEGIVGHEMMCCKPTQICAPSHRRYVMPLGPVFTMYHGIKMLA